MTILRIDSLNPLNPPEIIIEPKEPSEYFEEMVSDHLLEEYYENDTTFDEMERKYLSELIKWEKR